MLLDVFSEPFILVMEFVNYGTMRSFVSTHHEKLSADPEIQNLFTIAAYHIALAMEHLRSKMVTFPSETQGLRVEAEIAPKRKARARTHFHIPCEFTFGRHGG